MHNSADRVTRQENGLVTGGVIARLAIVLVAAKLVAGCAAGGGGAIADAGRAGPASAGLSTAQVDAVTAAARQMVADPAARVHGLTSRQASGDGGTHVCGYVTATAETEVPLYVELSEQSGTSSAVRGQVGVTPANLAKVQFMCRAPT